MKIIFYAPLVILTFMVQAKPALASATTHEYIQCHQTASQILLHCLNEEDRRGNECWIRARRSNDSCYIGVSKSHSTDNARVEAEKKAQEAMKKKFVD